MVSARSPAHVGGEDENEFVTFLMTNVINFLCHRLRELEREGEGGAEEARMVIIRSRPTDLFIHRQQPNIKIVCVI